MLNVLSVNVMDGELGVVKAAAGGQRTTWLAVEQVQVRVPAGPGAAGLAALYTEAVQVTVPGALMSIGFGLFGAVTVWVPADTSPARPVMVRVAFVPGAGDPIVQVPLA